MRAELCFILPLLQFAHSSKLTKSENERLKKICGATNLKRSTVLSFGGRHIRDDEYPWVISIAIQGAGIMCSGALISPRHVLTAGHCVRHTKDVEILLDEQCKELGYKNTNKLLAPIEKFTIVIGSRCKKLAGCPKSRTRDISAIYMPKTFDECSLNNDLAILELGKNVKEDMATPICTPHSSTVLSKNLKSAGNGAITPDDNAPIDGQQMVHVQIVKILDSNRIITTAVDGVGICSGDSGGPLFQTDRNRRNTIVGVMSSGNTCDLNYKLNRTVKSPKLPVDHHTDVRKFASWICSVSGVCP